MGSVPPAEITKPRAEEPSGAWTFSPFLMPLQDFLSKKLPIVAGCASQVFLASIHVKWLRIIICNVKLEASTKTQSKQIWVSGTLC